MNCRLFAVLAIALCFTASASASDGITVLPGEMTAYTSPSGYTYWKSNIDGYCYTRTWIPGSGYYGCGSGYCGSSYGYSGYWRYIPIACPQDAASDAQAGSLNLDDPYFEKRLADILVAEEGRKAQAQRHNERLELVQQLGLSNRLQSPGLANPLRYAAGASLGYGYGSPFIGRYGFSGTTLYSPGATYNSVVDSYGGTLNLDVMAQQSYMLGRDGVNNHATAFGKALDGHNAAIAQNAAAAKMRAAGDALAKTLQGSEQQRTTVQTTISGLQNPQVPNLSLQTGGQQVTVQPPVPVQPRLSADRWTLAQQSCIQCHGDQNPMGGYRVSQHRLLSPEQQMAIVTQHLLTGNMPRDPHDSSKPGTPLPTELQLEFMPPQQRVEAMKALLSLGK